MYTQAIVHELYMATKDLQVNDPTYPGINLETFLGREIVTNQDGIIINILKNFYRIHQRDDIKRALPATYIEWSRKLNLINNMAENACTTLIGRLSDEEISFIHIFRDIIRLMFGNSFLSITLSANTISEFSAFTAFDMGILLQILFALNKPLWKRFITHLSQIRALYNDITNILTKDCYIFPYDEHFSNYLHNLTRLIGSYIATLIKTGRNLNELRYPLFSITKEIGPAKSPLSDIFESFYNLARPQRSCTIL